MKADWGLNIKLSAQLPSLSLFLSARQARHHALTDLVASLA